MKAVRVLASAAAVGLVSCSAFAFVGWVVHERATLRFDAPSDVIELDAYAEKATSSVPAQTLAPGVAPTAANLVEVAYEEDQPTASASNGHHIMRVEGDTGQTY